MANKRSPRDVAVEGYYFVASEEAYYKALEKLKKAKRNGHRHEIALVDSIPSRLGSNACDYAEPKIVRFVWSPKLGTRMTAGMGDIRWRMSQDVASYFEGRMYMQAASSVVLRNEVVEA